MGTVGSASGEFVFPVGAILCGLKTCSLNLGLGEVGSSDVGWEVGTELGTVESLPVAGGDPDACSVERLWVGWLNLFLKKESAGVLWGGGICNCPSGNNYHC